MSEADSHAEWITEPKAEALLQTSNVENMGRILKVPAAVEIRLNGIALPGTLVSMTPDRHECLVFTHADGKLRELTMPIGKDIQRRVASLLGEDFENPKAARLAEPVDEQGELEETPLADVLWLNDAVVITTKGRRCKLELTKTAGGSFSQNFGVVDGERRIPYAELNADEGTEIDFGITAGDEFYLTRGRKLA
jgi:hypothetical protein